MRRKIVILLMAVGFALGLAVLPAGIRAATHETLPASFAAWNASNSEMPLAIGAIGVNSAILEEYGFASATQRSYSHGSAKLQIAAYRMKDPSGAYGLYSYLRTPELHRVDITEHASLAPARALILQGSIVLDVRGKNLTASQAEFKALAAIIAPQSDEGPYPVLYGHLPQTGFVNSSDRYILGPAALHELYLVGDGDWLGFASGAEAEVAKYRVNGQELTLLIVDYPTPQVAEKKLQEWSHQFNLNGADNGADKPVLFARRSLTLVAIVDGAHTEKQAALLLDHVHVAEELTWNEPNFSVTQDNIGTVIAGIITGTGVLCMFALIAGLAFGGFRLAIKRMLPGRVFDRQDQLNVLQLGLGSKPINSDDFYGLGKEARP
ncbi:MAG: DUF6599 family protein [Candidatus Acidiferrales bacterium]